MKKFFIIVFGVIIVLILVVFLLPKKPKGECGNGICGKGEEEACLSDCQAIEKKSLPVIKQTESEASPFGFLPALVMPTPEFHLNNPFDYAVDLGVRWHRTQAGFIWTLIQPDPNKGYDWSSVDRAISDLPEGMEMLANIQIGKPGADKNYYNYAEEKSFLPRPEKAKAYEDFVVAAVTRYKNKIKYWQVDNEPNAQGLKIETYAPFLQLTYDAIKKADPKAKVLIGGVPGMPPKEKYLEEFEKGYKPILEHLAGKKAFDIFDFHWYGEANNKDYRDVKGVYDQMVTTLKTLKIPYDEIWITEGGTYSGDPKAVKIDGAVLMRDYPLQTEKKQAEDLIKRYVYSLSFGVKKIFWAFGIKEGFKDDEGFFDFTGLVYDGKFANDQGLGAKKLGYYAYKKMTEVLEGSNWNNIQTIQEKDGVYVYEFFKNNQNIFVAWNESGIEKEISLPLAYSQNVQIIEAVPNAESGKSIKDYASAFSERLEKNFTTLKLGSTPVYVVSKLMKE